ncbi:M23 family metallopeptidase [Kroppenstedtia pulmonis]|uniref:M23 family metallopeptidase n=1 Tax=Kroppenstedtia pulmonis TaxID=1380685 RepID=A0A7D3Y161_9BACL|nr:M23 family metallopeptidase [Kroppenstedtia pulmonis]QKG84103.1 M23 family metallopeptidase [Kroppenstedtia pulmonis]
MRQWYQGVRKRREERVREIREGRNGFGYHGYQRHGLGQPVWQKEAGGKENLPWNRPGNWTKKKGKPERKLVIQAFIAFFLLTGTYLVFQSRADTGISVQSFITEVMERDYNFAGVSQWYQDNIGGSPSILPTFHRDDSRNREEKKASWVKPVKGNPANSFRENGRGLMIRTSAGSPVVSVAEGWVTDTTKKEGLGPTVVIRHADGRESWYGGLSKIRVRKKDWVKSGQLVGETGEGEGESLFFFAMRKDNRFIDPSQVISFE